MVYATDPACAGDVSEIHSWRNLLLELHVGAFTLRASRAIRRRTRDEAVNFLWALVFFD